MGTRNLTMVTLGGKTRVAQYGHWDGYPSGQGATALKFLRESNLDTFKKALEKVRFTTEKDEEEREAYAKSIGSNDGWMTMEQSALYNAKYPYSNMGIAAEILEMILRSTEDEIVLNNSESFAADSLFCEWAYVIDLDNNTFEVYEGFNETPLAETERFAKAKDEKSEYYPVKLVKTFDIANLPTDDEFDEAFEEEEE